MELLVPRMSGGRSMVDLSSSVETADGEVEPRTLEWKGLLRRAFSSKKRKRKKPDDRLPQSPSLLLTRPDGFTRKVKPDDVTGAERSAKLTSHRRVTSPTKRRIGLSKSNPLTVEQPSATHL